MTKKEKLRLERIQKAKEKKRLEKLEKLRKDPEYLAEQARRSRGGDVLRANKNRQDHYANEL